MLIPFTPELSANARIPHPGHSMFESQYRALRNLARRCLSSENHAQSFTPTLLVHEAFLSLARSRHINMTDQTQFLRLVARVMRNLLIDHARSRNAGIHGGALHRVDWNEAVMGSEPTPNQIFEIASAMERLAERSPQLARLVELRYFIGFSETETAEILQVCVRTVRRQWKLARLRLFELISGEPSHAID